MTRSSQPGSGSVIHLWLAGRSGPRGAEDRGPRKAPPHQELPALGKVPEWWLPVPCDMGPSQDRTCLSSWGLPPSPVSHMAIPSGSRPGEVSVPGGSGRGWPHAWLTTLLFVAAELEFAQVVVVVVVVTVMVVVIFCLLNHYRASTRSFIHRPGQGQRQEDRPQLVSVGWGWVSLGVRLGLGARAQDGTGLSS